MAANLDIDDRSLYVGSLRAITLSRLKATFGFNDEPQPAKTSNVNAVKVNDETALWLASIVGAFDDNPLYPLILQNEREARARMDEHFIAPE
jgi:hypothetical protein